MHTYQFLLRRTIVTCLGVGLFKQYPKECDITVCEWENTRKACKFTRDVKRVIYKLSRILPTSQAVYFAGKPIQSGLLLLCNSIIVKEMKLYCTFLINLLILKHL